jgi:hypothetical protein
VKCGLDEGTMFSLELPADTTTLATCIANSCASVAHQRESQYLNFAKCCNITCIYPAVFTTARDWSTHISTGVTTIYRKLCHMGMIVELTQAMDHKQARTLIVNVNT